MGVRGRAYSLTLYVLAACGGDGDEDLREQEPVGTVPAFCHANVIGVGMVPTETDYLPAVVACENGAAGYEALKAQAVAARSYLYYRMLATGDIQDGEGDQVYSCDNPPTADHVRAVDETRGEVLLYRDVQIAAFYVAGALQQPPACLGGEDDPSDTERFVTHNEGRTGDDVIQTTLGFVDPENHANRGCMSQNGADCLAVSGVGYQEILRFYYGDDIELFVGDGPCIDR